MLTKAIGKSIALRNPIVWLVGWGMLIAAYALSLQYHVFEKSWDYLIFVMQLTCDITIGITSLLAYRLRYDKQDKNFYLLVLISVIPGLFANEIYNILINIIDISRSQYIGYYWSVGYSLFLLVQLVAWNYLLKQNIVHNNLATKRWLTIYPYMQAATFILFSLIVIIAIRHGTAESIGNYRIFNSILEILVFTLISLSLSRTKTKALIYLETGFLLLIGFNFAHRYSDMLSAYYKAFDIVWLLCLVIIIYGQISAVKERKDKIEFYPENSIHVLTSGALILFANFILMIFLALAFGLSMLQADKFSNLGKLVMDIPSALVFSYTLTVLLARLFAYRLSMPLDSIVQSIDKITESNSLMRKDAREHFQIEEVQRVERFIIKTILELHHANQVKSEFLMNMSHDFRTPASGIQHMSKLIYDKLSDPELKRLQKMVINSSEQLMVLLEDVLDYSRLENDKLKLAYQEFDVANLINELIDVVTAKAHERNITILTKFQNQSMPCVGDKAVIKRIILNLLSNAIKFTHAGTVTVIAAYNNDKRMMEVRVKDTGIGIDPVNHAAIFEPFYRVESADTAKYPGIGLGLSNVKLMLKIIGGDISVVSALGQGAEFIMRLPIGEKSL